MSANARRIDRALFDGAGEDELRAVLGAYRNPDGGFGHALEPDVRTPSSQPLHTETALLLAREGGVRLPDWADAACEYLATVSASDGAMSAIAPDALRAPAAAHWQGAPEAPNLARTYGIATLLHWHGCSHAWLETAIDACRAAIADEASPDTHKLLGAVRFAQEVLEDDDLTAALLERTMASGFFVRETPIERYGLTPLHVAPAPDRNPGIDPALIERHLDFLMSDQADDGGWPIRFDSVSPGAETEWRGYFTAEAIRTLEAYGRI